MERKAEECNVKAEKELSRFFGGNSKYSKARDLYRQAGNFYKADGKWQQAAETFQRAQKLSAKLQEDIEEQDDMKNVANCFWKANAKPESLMIYEVVISNLLNRGKIAEAAKMCSQLGQECDTQKDFDNALHWYNKASKCYKQENSQQTARGIDLKIANIHTILGNYTLAIDKFQSLGREYASDSLLRLNARHMLFASCLCQLARIVPESKSEGVDTTQELFDDYTMTDPLFNANTWEYKLIAGMIDAFRSEDLESLREVIREYEEVNTIDEVKSKLFARIKDALKKAIQDER